MKHSRVFVAGVTALVAGAGWMVVRAQEPADLPVAPVFGELPVSDPQCTFFGPQRDKFVRSNAFANASALTSRIMTEMAAATGANAAATIPSAPGDSRTSELQRPSTNTVDRYIFDALTQKGVAPA